MTLVSVLPAPGCLWSRAAGRKYSAQGPHAVSRCRKVPVILGAQEQFSGRPSFVGSRASTPPSTSRTFKADRFLQARWAHMKTPRWAGMTTRATVFRFTESDGNEKRPANNVVDGGHRVLEEALQAVQAGWAQRKSAIRTGQSALSSLKDQAQTLASDSQKANLGNALDAARVVLNDSFHIVATILLAGFIVRTCLWSPDSWFHLSSNSFFAVVVTGVTCILRAVSAFFVVSLLSVALPKPVSRVLSHFWKFWSAIYGLARSAGGRAECTCATANGSASLSPDSHLQAASPSGAAAGTAACTCATDLGSVSQEQDKSGLFGDDLLRVVDFLAAELEREREQRQQLRSEMDDLRAALSPPREADLTQQLAAELERERHHRRQLRSELEDLKRALSPAPADDPARQLAAENAVSSPAVKEARPEVVAAALSGAAGEVSADGAPVDVLEVASATALHNGAVVHESRRGAITFSFDDGDADADADAYVSLSSAATPGASNNGSNTATPAAASQATAP
eukprot:CAMPEP_0118932598 /NCGR_PEP_ID=MMETSP1169-20130426/10517_1 /TAXON_ID=36882 /ORGANISM="Pyramimonas obovata, Strain CCMP722" /LENGTH=512 /DNA_ID=CAMNT_0006875281 /DNA_START=263 /DNA_END=1797 /DNA_ORIENTATION=+